MIAWLSDWLRDIIAVILLAAFVELLLPNKSMQRYTRLVLGLFILITILSPILKLINHDTGERLEAGIELWNERAMTREVRMPSLEDIQKKANELSEKRNQEAAKLAGRMLEEEMLQGLVDKTAVPVQSVEVSLAWNEQDKRKNAILIHHVVVKLRPPSTEAEVRGRQQLVESVEPVSVNVEVQPVDIAAKPAESSEAASKQSEPQIDQAAAAEIIRVLKQEWGVAAEQIDIIPGETRR